MSRIRIPFCFFIITVLTTSFAVVGDVAEAGIQTAGSIHGVKWEDLNGNAERDPREPGLAGVAIYLDVNGNGAFDRGEPNGTTMRDDPLTAVDETERYWIENVQPGSYLVREVVPDGFVQTFPRPSNGKGRAEGGGGLLTGNPAMIQLQLQAAEVSVRAVSLTIHPFCVRP